MKFSVKINNIKFITIVLLSFVFLTISCSKLKPTGLSEADIAIHNRGVALMGQYDYSGAEEVFASLLEKYPGETSILINHAISILNRQKEGDDKLALSILQRVLDNEPDNLSAMYCCGLLELHSGNPVLALSHFLTVLEKDPDDAEALYFSAKSLMELHRYEEALEYFDKTIERDSYIQSAYYGKVMAYRQLKQIDRAREVITMFKRLKSNPRSRLVEFKYTKMGEKAEVSLINKKNIHVKKPEGSVFDQGRPLVPQDLKWAEGLTSSPNITVCDINGDSFSDIFISGAFDGSNGKHNAVLLWDNTLKQFLLADSHPFTSVTQINCTLWGDVDDDGYPDVYFCRNGENIFFRSTADGQWSDQTASYGVGNGDFNTVDGMMFDADHDGDLDIFLVNSNGPNELMNNNRNGTFRMLAEKYNLKGNGGISRFIVVADLDCDRDADIVVINESPPHQIFINELLWSYSQMKESSDFMNSEIECLIAEDFDTDGYPELLALDSGGQFTKWVYSQKKELIRIDAEMLEIQSGSTEMSVSDVDGDGHLDILVKGQKEIYMMSPYSKTINTVIDDKEMDSYCVMNTQDGPALIGYLNKFGPVLYSPGEGRFQFALFRMFGKMDDDTSLRSNSSGIGTKLSVRAESRWTVLNTFRQGPAPGQSLQPVSVGIGDAPLLDFVTFDWTDGVFQTEMNLEAGKVHGIHETQRQLSSCPVLFAWDGVGYEFVSDFLGVGGIGYSIGPGDYSESRPWENFMLPDNLLKEKDGRYLFKLTEPMEEVAMIDSIQLKTYELPVGWSMVLNERMGILGPIPDGKPFFYRHSMYPVSAVNDRGDDVTEYIINNDLKAAPVGDVDQRFIGLLRHDHVLTLEFDQPLTVFNGQPVLVVDGWVEYPYSQTSFAAWQADALYMAPSLEMRLEDGCWVKILEQFGYPAGMPRRMSVPLDHIPDGVTALRLTTNQEIYWDSIFVAYAETCEDVSVQILPLVRADVEQIGFPEREPLPQRRPYYNYDTLLPVWDTRFQEGFYTNFGDALELVKTNDNALCIYGAGEGIHLEFEKAFPLYPDRKQVFVMEFKGWCKDVDMFTLTGATIEPLPCRGVPDKKVEELHERYNIRYLSGRQ